MAPLIHLRAFQGASQLFDTPGIDGVEDHLDVADPGCLQLGQGQLGGRVRLRATCWYVAQFIDEHPEVDIKFVTTNIGMFDGKFKDLALIVNVWY